MSLIDKITGVIAPHDCIACGQEGQLVCGNCVHKWLSGVPGYCYRCRDPVTATSLCAECAPSTPLSSVRAAVLYDGLAKELILRLKFQGAQAAADIAVDLMAPLVFADERTFIVPVPTASRRARQRGYDQAKIAARLLAKKTQLPYWDCLQRTGQTHQLGSSRRERLSNLQAAFNVRRGQFVATDRFILVDDVLTTGATLEAAANALRLAGAQNINAIVFAQA